MWYELRIKPDSNGTFIVTAPLFEELTTFGTTPEDACYRGRDALEEAIAGRMAANEPIPRPMKTAPRKRAHRQQYVVEMSPLVLVKSALHMELLDAGMTRSDLAEFLGWHEVAVDDLFSLDHITRNEELEEAFAAVGRPISLRQ